MQSFLYLGLDNCAWFIIRLSPMEVCYGLVSTFPLASELGGSSYLKVGRRFVSKSSAKFVEPWRLTFSFLGTNSFLIMTSISETSLLLTNMKNRCKITCAWSGICCAFIPLAHLVSCFLC